MRTSTAAIPVLGVPVGIWAMGDFHGGHLGVMLLLQAIGVAGWGLTVLLVQHQSQQAAIELVKAMPDARGVMVGPDGAITVLAQDPAEPATAPDHNGQRTGEHVQDRPPQGHRGRPWKKGRAQ